MVHTRGAALALKWGKAVMGGYVGPPATFTDIINPSDDNDEPSDPLFK